MVDIVTKGGSSPSPHVLTLGRLMQRRIRLSPIVRGKLWRATLVFFFPHVILAGSCSCLKLFRPSSHLLLVVGLGQGDQSACWVHPGRLDRRIRLQELVLGIFVVVVGVLSKVSRQLPSISICHLRSQRPRIINRFRCQFPIIILLFISLRKILIISQNIEDFLSLSVITKVSPLFPRHIRHISFTLHLNISFVSGWGVNSRAIIFPYLD